MFENVLPWLEGERDKHGEMLASFKSGALRLINAQTEDISPEYIVWLNAKIGEMDDLIVQHSSTTN